MLTVGLKPWLRVQVIRTVSGPDTYLKMSIYVTRFLFNKNVQSAS